MNLTYAEELETAKKRGFLLTRRPLGDEIYREWGRWCDRTAIPDVSARSGKKYAHVRLDMASGGKPLSELGLHQAIVLLFGERHLEIHRKLRARPRDHGLGPAEIDRHLDRVGRGDPAVLIGSKRVPTERAEVVAEQLAKLAQESLHHNDSVR